jgi:ATP-dependent Lhr-like helicase
MGDAAGSSAVLGSTAFAVVDAETTGFSPRLSDRIIEVAVVRLSPQGEPVQEYTSLVNPRRDVGPTHVHGITATDVRDAPDFADIAGDVASLLDGAVLVAHNLRFDRSFLEAEFARTANPLPPLPGLCTLAMAYRLEPGSASRRLSECCARHRIAVEQTHSALGDARAAARLFVSYLGIASGRGAATLEALGCTPVEMPARGWLTLRPSGRSWCRRAAVEATRQERSYLAAPLPFPWVERSYGGRVR